MFGETVTLPDDIPAKVVMLQAKAVEDPDAAIGVFDLLALIVGQETVDGWIEAGMPFAQARALLGQIGKAWNDPGEAPPPAAGANRATRRATKKKAAARSPTPSSGGRTSRATSKRTTGST